MATQLPPAISPVPTPAIQRNDRTTFSNRVDAFVTWLITAVGQFGAVATNVYNNAVDAATSATSALTNKGLSQNAADAAESYRTQAKNSADAAAASALTIGTTAAFSDANPVVRNAADPTKRGRFIASGITSGAIRDIEWPDKNGKMATTADTGLALVGGPLILTASANVDFLTLFSSLGNAFDNYTIVINRPQPVLASGADLLCLRFAVGGVVEVGNFYASFAPGATGGPTGSTMGVASIRGQDSVAGTVRIDLENVNSASSLKTASTEATTGLSGGSVSNSSFIGAYSGANVVSGFRLYWNGGANFVAGAVVRVYGWKNQ